MCDIQRSEQYQLGVLDTALAMSDIVRMTGQKELEDSFFSLIEEIQTERIATFLKEHPGAMPKALR
jgi:hypothetical protein